MRYDGKSLQTEACDRKRNVRLILDAAKHCMHEVQYLEFRDDVGIECTHKGQPDGLRCVCMLSVCTLSFRIEIVCTFCAHSCVFVLFV